MPITDVTGWEKCVESNKDPYGKACVDVAREAMRMLDEEEKYSNSLTPKDTFQLICDANTSIKAGGITGFMAGCVASIISNAHSRGEEFRKQWNRSNSIGGEGEEANDSGGVINPALLHIELKEE